MKIFIIGMCAGATGLFALILINSHIKNTVSDYIVSMEDISDKDIEARAKDFATTIIRPEPTYLGEKIDIHGDGDVTND